MAGAGGGVKKGMGGRTPSLCARGRCLFVFKKKAFRCRSLLLWGAFVRAAPRIADPRQSPALSTACVCVHT
jgi:hypothetical protein